jgi:hypothetical protein
MQSSKISPGFFRSLYRPTKQSAKKETVLSSACALPIALFTKSMLWVVPIIGVACSMILLHASISANSAFLSLVFLSKKGRN